jgi:hypothetical protein
MKTPPVVSPQEWAAARQHLLAKEKEVMRAHDELAAQRRRMPWLPVDNPYEFDRRVTSRVRPTNGGTGTTPTEITNRRGASANRIRTIPTTRGRCPADIRPLSGRQ